MKNVKIFLNVFIPIMIMVLAKLFPFVPCNWEQDFCNNWNDIWFGIACSYLPAYALYYYTILRPDQEFKKHILPVLSDKMEFVVEEFERLFNDFGAKGCLKNSKDEDIANIIKTKNWADESENGKYVDIVKEVMYDVRVIITELLPYKDYLSNDQILALEELKNMTYRGKNTAQRCKTNSEEMKTQVIIKGNILLPWLELYEKDRFIDDVLLPSYRKTLELNNKLQN